MTEESQADNELDALLRQASRVLDEQLGRVVDPEVTLSALLDDEGNHSTATSTDRVSAGLVDESHDMALRPRAPERGSRVKQSKILLVDDRPENLVALEAMLGALDQTLVRATSGEEALKALLVDDFAVILLDVRMPDMDGFDTAAHIKRRERTKDIPIIFLTAVPDGPHHTFRGYGAGAVDYLVKPFDPWILRAKVSVFVELHRKNLLLKEQAQLLTDQLAARDGAGRDGARLVAELAARLAAVEENVRGLERLAATGQEQDPETLAAVSRAELGAAMETLTTRLSRLRSALNALDGTT
jgi:response regulator RpfG family c-di-GMP phosphodiesterase